MRMIYANTVPDTVKAQCIAHGIHLLQFCFTPNVGYVLTKGKRDEWNLKQFVLVLTERGLARPKGSRPV